MNTSIRQRKNYPGEARTPGTKDYGLIMGNLMNYRNLLFRLEDEIEIGEAIAKLAEKLKELGFSKESQHVKKKLGRRKNGNFHDVTSKKKDEAIEVSTRCWETAKERHENARAEKKKKEKEKSREEA